MATIRLPLDAALKGKLPHVCLRCGAPAKELVTREFWVSPFSYSTRNILGAAAEIVMTKPITLRLPLCADHKNHWVQAGFRLFLLKWLVIPIALVTVVWGFVALVGLDNLSELTVLIGVGVVALASLVLLRTRLLDAVVGPIAVVEVTTTEVTLTGVASGPGQRSSNR